MDPVSACAQLGGIARWAELSRLGVTRRDVDRALTSAVLTKAGRGIYALPDVSPTRQELFRLGAHLTCVSALRAFTLPATSPDSNLHVAMPHGHSFSAGHQQPQWRTTVHYLARELVRKPNVLMALDTSSRCLSRVNQLAAIDAALNRNMIKPVDLARFTVTSSKTTRWLQRHSDEGAQSPPETWTRVALVTAGLPVVSQVNIPGVGRVDFVVDGTVVVEVDGQTYHMNERSFETDRRRDRVTQLGDRMALRFTRHDVENSMPTVVETVTQAVNLVRARSGRPAIVPRPFERRFARRRQ